MTLTRERARAYYDWFGSKQDSQAFYEDAAIDDLIAHAAFESAEHVFEFGCGTGRLASRLLTNYLPPTATYLGVDLSPTMVDIARERLEPCNMRAKVVLSDGAINFPLPDHSVDRVISTYVLDLLSETDMRQAIAESLRVLSPGGRLCLASLTTGTTLTSRTVSAIWTTVYRIHASLVGGCRPIQLEPLLPPDDWSIQHRNVVRRFGIASEVLVAAPASSSR
jgi:ubiquinone/menaquinone biosynthesis C-methylase UbiE